MKLKELRKQKNKTQKEMADLLGIAHSSYLSYEKEINEPNIKNLIKLADFYGVSIDYLVGREWHNEIGYLTPTQMQCVNLIKQLNDTSLALVLGYIQATIAMQ